MSYQEATLRALANPELLTMILSYLSPPDLFFSAHHVSHFWHDLIRTTSHLQNIILYRAHPHHQHSSTNNDNTEMAINPILVRALPMFFQSQKWVDVFSFRNGHGKALAERGATFREMPIFVSGKLEEGWKERQLCVIEEVLIKTSFHQRLGMLPIPDGMLRMGMLVDLTMKWCASDPNASFVIRWRKEHLLSSIQHRPIPQTLATEHGFWNRVFGRPKKVVFPNENVHLGYPLIGVSNNKVIEVVLFKAVETYNWLTDIVDEKPTVMPREWVGMEGGFRECEVEFEGPYNVAHPFRLPRRTRKYRR